MDQTVLFFMIFLSYPGYPGYKKPGKWRDLKDAMVQSRTIRFTVFRVKNKKHHQIAGAQIVCIIEENT